MRTPNFGVFSFLNSQHNEPFQFTGKPQPLFLMFILNYRHKCSACFKQYKKKEHLVEHMKVSYHSVHQPKCGVCQKHCKSFESLREHLTGAYCLHPLEAYILLSRLSCNESSFRFVSVVWDAGQLSKDNCSKVFYHQGCNFCLKVFDSPITRSVHKWSCCLPAPTPLGTVTESYTDALVNAKTVSTNKQLEAIAVDCEMVGGGTDGLIGICARVCLVDEDENVIFHTYVKPEISVTDYRSKVTGLTEEHLRDAMPFKEVQEKVKDILHSGNCSGVESSDGKATKILVGHSLEYDLACLKLEYPEHLIRDTATYPPLMKTNLVSHSLKYLAKTYLGYDIQCKIHDPYEDTVSVMRLYKRLRDQDHLCNSHHLHQTQFSGNAGFDAYQMEDLEKMSPDELYEISKSPYRCWCLDRVNPCQP